MAGIGFRLQKIMEEGRPFASLRAHFVSALITSGPWIFSIVTLSVLNLLSSPVLDLYEQAYFRTLITYTFAFSYIVVGVFHLALTRYAADKLYAGDEGALLPALNSAAAVLLLIQAGIGAAFGYFSAEGTATRILSGMIYLTVSLMWLLMSYLTALRSYRTLLFAYGVGSAAALGAGWPLGLLWGLNGYLAAYLIGHFLIVVFLAARVFAEFPSTVSFDREYVSALRRLKLLVAAGFFYNAALWVDKIVLWCAPNAEAVGPILRANPFYESAVFFAYLTIIPSLTIFLVTMETRFYRAFRRFYGAILGHAPLPVILRMKSQMAERLRESFKTLLRYQGFLTVVVLLFASEIAVGLGLTADQVPLFRIAVLGAFVHALLTMTLLLILYFDFQGLAVRVSVLFFATHGGLTWLTSRMPLPYLGYGYFAAALICLALAYYALAARFQQLEFLTFAPQQVAVHREEEIA